ncbi:MAG: RteC domain-containing protein [Monoglobales bacterium]
MQNFIADLNNKLAAQLQTVELQTHNIIDKSLESLAYVKNALNELKAFLLEYTFENEEEEILFFKKLKPDLQSKHIYHRKMTKIESLRPVGCHEEQEKYLRQRLKKLTFFFNEHKEFYQYYRMRSTHLDDKYFVRRRLDLTQKIDSTDFDEDFSTIHDYTIAKIIAYDQLETYLNFEIEKIALKSRIPHVEHLGILGKFKWTGTKIELEELTYSLADSGAINNGKCEINELSEALGILFDIEIKDSIYRDLQDIKRRKNPTQFLDDLKKSLLRRIEKTYK